MADRAEDRRLDETCAREVAVRFLHAASTPREPAVAAAYQALKLQTDRLFGLLTQGKHTAPTRVVFTRCRAPYASDLEMIAAVRAMRILEIVTSAADQDRWHPVLGNGIGGGYDRFRAVHDLVGHVRCGHGFDRYGEYAAWLAQDSLYHGDARLALANELHAEHSVLWTTGVLAEHKATLMSADVFRRARHGLQSPAPGPRQQSRRACRSGRPPRNSLVGSP